MRGFIASTDLVGLIDIGCYFVEDHVQLLSCVVIYDVQQTIRDWGVDPWYQQHLLRKQEHLSSQTTKDMKFQGLIKLPSSFPLFLLKFRNVIFLILALLAGMRAKHIAQRHLTFGEAWIHPDLQARLGMGVLVGNLSLTSLTFELQSSLT